MFLLGAPEMLLPPGPEAEALRSRVATQAPEGRRLLLLAAADQAPRDHVLPAQRRPLALVVLEDQVRPGRARRSSATSPTRASTLKVISGDHPATVAAVARRAGLPGAGVRIRRARPAPTSGQLAEILTRAQRLRSGEPTSEAGDGGRVAVAWAHRGDDR